MLGTRSFGAVRCSSKKEAKKKASIVVLNELKEEGELETLEKKKRKRSIRVNTDRCTITDIPNILVSPDPMSMLQSI